MKVKIKYYENGEVKEKEIKNVKEITYTIFSDFVFLTIILEYGKILHIMNDIISIEQIKEEIDFFDINKNSPIFQWQEN